MALPPSRFRAIQQTLEPQGRSETSVCAVLSSWGGTQRRYWRQGPIHIASQSLHHSSESSSVP